MAECLRVWGVWDDARVRRAVRRLLAEEDEGVRYLVRRGADPSHYLTQRLHAELVVVPRRTLLDVVREALESERLVPSGGWIP